MSSTIRKKNTSFEDAMGQLEKIVQALEGGEIPLSELLKRYGEGMQYLHICQEHLNHAKLVLEQLNNKNETTKLSLSK